MIPIKDKAVLKALEKDEKQIIKEIAKEMGETEGNVRRILYGRKNGKAKWEEPE